LDLRLSSERRWQPFITEVPYPSHHQYQMLYRGLIRPVLFRLFRNDPEQIHELTVDLLHRLGGMPGFNQLARRLASVRDPALERELWGIRFPNPVGLAAGFDKEGRAVSALASLGFGFLEIGTVTWRPQPGNPRPRLVRLPRSEAIINRMGFNNSGAQALQQRLQAMPRPAVPIGISLGKSKLTPEQDAAQDYCSSLRVLYPFLDYYAVNISSPNTPGLRNLQARERLDELLACLQRTALELAGTGVAKPLLVKIAPDLSREAVVELLGVCVQRQVAGIIATNTTLARDGVAAGEQSLAQQAGGLSGRPLTERSREMVAFIHRETGGSLPIVGVGGILTPDDALRMFDAGASLIQLYTGLVYQGIGLVKGINNALLRRRHEV
jgi:dihydroorotate dehydrogenase